MPTLGAPNLKVFPDRVEILNGAGTLDDEVIFTSRPLVEAIHQAVSGDVIGVYGDCTTGNAEAMWLGGAQDANKYHHGHWGDEPMNFAVVGMTPDAKITGFAVARGISYDGTPTAGIGDVMFSNLTMQNSRWNQMAIAGNKGVTFGRLRLYNMHFEPHPARLAAGNDGGFGAKWWIRVPSWGSWDVRNCSFEGVQEHSIYIDSPQGDNFFVGIEHTRSWRTAIQIVNRAWELPNPPQGSTPAQSNAFWNDLIAEYESGAVQPAPSGQGRILIRDVTMQGIYGEGGSGVTVVGFDGDVYLENVTAVDDGPFHGAIVLWTDAGIKHGVHLFTGADGNLYSIRRVFLINPTINLPQADRDLIAIAGAEEVHIINFDIAGNRPAIALSSTFGTPNMQGMLAVVDGQVTRLPDTEPLLISNGHEEFYVPRPVSQYAGFRAAGKVRVGAYLLSDTEIDSRWQ